MCLNKNVVKCRKMSSKKVSPMDDPSNVKPKFFKNQNQIYETQMQRNTSHTHTPEYYHNTTTLQKNHIKKNVKH
jgi:hypothetical protein